MQDYSKRKCGGCRETLLHFCARFIHKKKDTHRLLLENGAGINASDMFGNSPLHTAVSYNNYEMAKWLLDNGAFVDSQNIQKKTPLHCAAVGNIKLCTLLLNRGADANYKNKDEMTPLSHAVKQNDTEIVMLMLTNGGDVSGINFLDSSQHIRNLCEQNEKCSAGNTFISHNRREQIP